jgi:pimeloyl-ACP methyl ester carboxylesterase
MQRAEIRDGGALLGTALGEIAELARDVHSAVAGRVFRLLGPVAAPVGMLHDTIAAIAYGSSRFGVRAVPGIVGSVAAESAAPRTTSVSETPRGHFAVSALNGFWGDRLAARHSALAPELALRTHTGRLRRVPGNVVHDVGTAATGKLVVFLHGLCENDRYWWYRAQKSWGGPSVTYGSLLHEERGWTPLYAHYNTGLHVSDNGRLLSDFLDRLVGAWPVPVREIALVGHSMGGLVARSAACQAADDERSWVSALRHVVGLGVPHLGAPLERLVNAGTHHLARLPETRPFATWLNRRSVGIKDLRYGAVVAADWTDHHPDDRADQCTPAVLLPGVGYSMVSATLSQHPQGRLAHDLLVEHVSAHGTGQHGTGQHGTGRSFAARRIEFEVDRLFHVGRRTHFHLLDDPVVYRRLRSWLDGSDGADGAADPVR